MPSEPVATVNGIKIGSNSPAFVIAEMSGNHNGELQRALDIVQAVGETGAQALKIQTYTADTITIDCDRPEFRVRAQHELWGGRTLHDLYREAHTPWEWHAEIFDKAKSVGLLPFSTPFDPTAIEFLEGLGASMYKIASAEIVDLPLIREVASTGKPLIMSTGMASIGEIDAAMDAARDRGSGDIVLLACTASYPATPEESHLSNIALLRHLYGVPVGLSDHTLGVGVAIAAITMGASCIEKHVTLNRGDSGVDSAFSAEPDELRMIVRAGESARVASRTGTKFGATESEATMLRLRRSLYVTEDVRRGDVVSAENVRSIRPAGGLPPQAMSTVLGRQFAVDVSRGTPLTWELI